MDTTSAPAAASTSAPAAAPTAALPGATPADGASAAPLMRYFLSYRGVTLPLTLMEELDADGLRHRNTYYCAAYDTAGRMLWLEQRVYGEVALRHDYHWNAEGRMHRAVISVPDEDPLVKDL